MANATFYLLQGLLGDKQDGASADDSGLAAKAQRFYCEQIAELYRQYRQINVWTASQQAAEALDEALWKLPVDAFIPHNLQGEGPANGAPVEIQWPQSDNRSPRRSRVLVNLSEQVPPHAQQTQVIVDFVPLADSGKQQARERYKQYRAWGMQMQSTPASLIEN
ncbi:DNA polymerase III subunit chi [Idiomarina xiamenensis]|uniref:DNA polymerase III subunit chi n=1 Tax=Idiomarina xiamenensis 10-D-4 TaxID=740709 RepID=K2KMM8_9GAMM|nr:DNA polymerase III subunit chi [Idiomarina xiamenensis]EKE83684.1 DNA polymerase III subunit chi [Idiomarina xiamenensis 10-D-4]